jgi:monoamine oxidase
MIHNTDPLDVIIVGGGLSGLVTARNISKQNKTWKLLEASNVLGGRLQNDLADNKVDLGGAWIWPNQDQMLKLVESLTLNVFRQPGGDEQSPFRVVGGAEIIVNTIVDELDASCIERNCEAKVCRQISDNLVSVELSSGKILNAKTICLACAPKIIDLHIQFHPPLSISKTNAMSSSQTWMAGVTKVALIYNCVKFWPEQMSNEGLRPGKNRPAFQYYDASPQDGTVCALTFFTLAALSSSEGGIKNDKKLARDCADQLCESLSGFANANTSTIAENIRQFDEFQVKRWPLEKFISETKDPTSIAPHPEPNKNLAISEWNGMLLFAGTESDLISPGLMEGAVNSANRATREILSSSAQNV